MHALHQLVHGLLENIEQRLRVNSDPERQSDERKKRCVFTRVQVGQMLVRRIGYVSKHHPLVKPEQICRAKYYAEYAPGCPLPAHFKHTAQNRKFADESIQ